MRGWVGVSAVAAAVVGKQPVPFGSVQSVTAGRVDHSSDHTSTTTTTAAGRRHIVTTILG